MIFVVTSVTFSPWRDIPAAGAYIHRVATTNDGLENPLEGLGETRSDGGRRWRCAHQVSCFPNDVRQCVSVVSTEARRP